MSRPNVDSMIGDLRRALEANPDDAISAHNLSVLLGQRGAASEALTFAEHATAGQPDLADAWLNLGNLKASAGRFDEAIPAFQRVTNLKPGDPRGWQNLGNCLAKSDRFEEAAEALEQAHFLYPHNPDILGSLALTYRRLWRYDDALTAYQKALAIDPANAKLHSNIINALHYRPGIEPETLLDAHRTWAAAHAPAASPYFHVALKEDRPMRVGYVSGDFRSHPIGFFLSGVLACHDRSKVIPVCLSDTVAQDEMTARLKSTKSEWIETAGMNAEAFAAAARQANLDIAIDLSGHFQNNRLPEFTQRIAPVQATWAGYVGTTGVPAMDWLIADSHHAPDGFEAYVTERIIRLPDDYVCYSPPPYSPAPGSLPFDRNGVATFGCFNNPFKLNPSIIAAWAQILRSVSASRLVLKYKGLDQPSVSRAITGLFVSAGVDADRIDLRGSTPHADLLATYQEIDLALDPWPYSGGLTTLEALWMGVPVLTLSGRTFAGRHSTAHLMNVGLSDWVVGDTQAYVATAVQKPADPDSLRTLRMSLRERMRDSPPLDHQRFTRTLECAFKTMWESACMGFDTSAPRVIDVPPA